MALAETAELGVRLTLDDSQMGRAVQRIDRRLGALSGAINRNLGRAIDTGVSRLVRGAFGALQAGLNEIREDNVALAQTRAVLESTGGAAGVTADAVTKLADELENLTGIEDDVIQNAENLLLTFTNIKKDVFPEVTALALDMSAALGTDAGSAAQKLGRALQDPVKGLAALTKAGVTFTEGQRDQIEKLTKQGKLQQAQKIILDEVAKKYKGVAAAQAEADPSRRFQRSVEKLQSAFASGLLPSIEKIQRRLTDVFNDPKTQASISKIGDAVAGLLTDENIDTVFAGIKTAADAVGIALNAFNQLPTEVKALAIGAFAINKVTGGGVTAAASAFGKILGAGLSRIFAANVTVIGKSVTGAGLGGVPAAGAAGAGAGRLGGAVNVVAKVAAVGLAAEIGKVLHDEVTAPLAREINQNLFGGKGALEHFTGIKISPEQLQWPFGPKNTPTILPELFGKGGLLGGDAGVGAGKQRNDLVKTSDAGAVRSIQALSEKVATAGRVTANTLDRTGRAGVAASNQTRDAVRHKRLAVTVHAPVTVNTSVAYSEVKRQAKYTSRVARTTSLAYR